MYVYTKFKEHFRMGGELWHPHKADVGEPLEQYDFPDAAGVKRKIAVFQNPMTGYFHVAERESGGLVGFGKEIGLAIAAVVEDLATGDASIIDGQIEKAKREMAQAKEVTPEEFWRGFKKERQVVCTPGSDKGDMRGGSRHLRVPPIGA